MPKAVAVAMMVLLSTTLASAQMKVTPQQNSGTSVPLAVTGAQVASQQFERISQADALKLFREGKAVFIDVRSNEQFTLGHIKDAHSIPGSQLIKRFGEVPPRKTYITYCACSAEESSGAAAANLVAHGVKNVYALKGGWQEWKAAGHPIAVGPK
jgi:rhodanese-related sulfurtransferase